MGDSARVSVVDDTLDLLAHQRRTLVPHLRLDQCTSVMTILLFAATAR
jgi:hypothetical protein